MMLKYTEFEFGFVLAAIGIALTAGFGYAAVLAVMIGFDLSMGNWWAAMLQAHGHAQLMGWTGLFIIGVSLYFVPRLAGVSLRFPRLLPWTCAFLTFGILFRTLAQPLLHSYPSETVRLGLRWVMGLSGTAEAIGVGFYLILLVGTVRRAARHRPALRSVRIFLLMAVCGWVFYTAISSTLVLFAAYEGNTLVRIAWNRFGIGLFVGLVLLPVAMAFSIRTFPLYLRLPAADWPVRGIGIVYLLALTLEQLPVLIELLNLFPEQEGIGRLFSSFGGAFKGGTLLFFIWKLDILFRRRSPWTSKRIGAPGPDRRPTRKGLPDYGEFGRFEWLLYAAYAWLALGAGLECIAGLAALGGMPSPAGPDAVRHIYLAGFISLLIFGMAPRMVPGFLHKRRVAYPALVAVTFWVAGAAAFFRVGPLVLSDLLDRVPGGLMVSMAAFGISGLLSWTAVAILGWNLWATRRLKKAAQ